MATPPNIPKRAYKKPLPGYLSTEEWAEQWDRGERQARDLLNRSVKEGLAKFINVKNEHGCVVRYFKFKD